MSSEKLDFPHSSCSPPEKTEPRCNLDFAESAFTSVPKRRTTWSYLNEQVREDLFLELELLLLAFGIGIQDACTYPDYACFASNQTGNTVLLAIGFSGLSAGPLNLANIGISLSLFIAGGLIAGQAGNLVGTRRRLWLLISSLIQTAMVWTAVVLQYHFPVQNGGPVAYIVLSLLAFSSAAQVAMARGLKITEITTAMATAAYVDLIIDPYLYKPNNRGRNRRASFLLTLAAGSFAGAHANKAVSSAFALVIAATVKTISMAGLFFNKPMNAAEIDSQKQEKILMLG